MILRLASTIITGVKSKSVSSNPNSTHKTKNIRLRASYLPSRCIVLRRPTIILFYFFCNIGSFDPLCVRSPLDTLESGVLFHIMVVETFTCFTRRSTMESSVVSSLPDCAFTPTLASTGWSNQLWNTLAKLVGIAPHVSHIVETNNYYRCILLKFGWLLLRVILLPLLGCLLNEAPIR